MSEKIKHKDNLPNLSSKLNERLKNLENKVRDRESARSLTKTPFVCYLLIDCSGSMTGSKLLQAKAGAIDFSMEAFIKGYAVGVIAFSSNASQVIGPQTNINKMRSPIKNIVLGGSTNLSDALRLAKMKLSEKYKSKVIVIITDGMPDNTTEALKLAKELKSLGIEIIAIGTDDADQSFLEKIASNDRLAIPVLPHKLASAINNSAKFLPQKVNQ